MMPKKINLLIIGNFSSQISTEAFLRKYLKIMDTLSEKIFLYSGDCPQIFRERVNWIDTNSFVSNKNTNFFARIYAFFLRDLKLVIAFNKLLKEERIEKVILIGYSFLGIVYLKIKGKTIILHKGGKPYVLSSNIILQTFSKIAFEYFPYWISNQIIVEGKLSIKFQNLQNFAQKVVVIPLFVDDILFSYKKEFSKRKKCIGYFGSLVQEKGVQEFLIAIIEILKENRDLEILIGGGGIFEERVKKIAKEYPNVTFLGWVSHEELSEFLNELKLLVLPSYGEGLPNIMLEAMACGTPVLATSVGAIPDVIKDRKTGFIIEKCTPECIAQNILCALNDPNLEQISQNGRALIINEYTYERAVQRYGKILSNEID